MPTKRPEFKLPSTKPAAAKAAKTEWVYRTDEGPALSKQVSREARDLRVEGVDRNLLSKFTIDRYATYSGAAGFIPIPFVDVVAIGTMQLKLIKELCAIYGVSFNDQTGKSLIAALVGSLGATRLAYDLGSSFLRAIPIVGAITNVLAMPAMGYGATWAIGKVFVLHFESGGTLVDVDVPKMRAQFQEELA